MDPLAASPPGPSSHLKAVLGIKAEGPLSEVVQDTI